MTGTDARLGARLAWKHRLMTLTVVTALAIGIALATGAFTFFRAVAEGRLPFPAGDRFVRLEAFTEPEGRRTALEIERFRLLAEEASSFEYLGRVATGSANLLLGSGEVESVLAARVTLGLFAYAPYRPAVGRTLVAADGAPGAEPVAVIRESLWERRFGRDPAVVGGVLDVAGVPHTVVGVAPDDYRFPASGELWMALTEGAPATGTGSPHAAGTVGVLRRESSLTAAAEQVRHLSERFDAALGGREAKRVEVVDYTDLRSFGIEQMLAATVVMTVLVLLVVAANVANLIYARTAARSAELALRSALGASRGRVVAQLFVEVALLAGVAALAGVAISQRALGWLQHTLEVDELPFWLDLSPHPSTVAIAAAAALVASLVAGALPALKATRRDLVAALRGDSGRGGGFGFGRVGGTMMVVEMALSVALVTSAVGLARGVARYGELAVPLPDREVLSAQLWLEPDADESVPGRRERLQEALAALPGARDAGLATSLPRMSPGPRPLRLEPLGADGVETGLRAPVVGATPGFLAALDARALAGRLLTERDLEPGAPPVAVVNEPFVAQHFGGRNPIGRRLRLESEDGAERPEPWREIVGVVPDLGLVVGDPERAAGLYVPLAEDGLIYVAARAAVDPARLANPLRRAVFDVDPGIPVRRVERLDAVANEDRVGLRVFAGVLLAVGGTALGLALVGLYAIVSFTVTLRRREIGVRIALGAAPRQILASLFGRAAALLAVGGVAGSALAALLVQARGAIFASTLPGAGPWLFPAVLLLLVVVGLLACHAPARRALAISPSEALTDE